MRIRFLPLAAAMAALALPALAEHEANAPTATGETGLFTLPSGQTLPDGAWSFSLYYNNWDRLVAPIDVVCVQAPCPTSNWDYDWNRLSLSLAYAVTDRFELALSAPYEDFSASDINRIGYVNGKLFLNEIDASGPGNLRLAGKWRLSGDAESETAFALGAFVELPTGDDDEAVVTGDTGFGVGAHWSLRKWVLSAGYRDPGDADNFDVAEEILAGAGYAGSVTDRMDWITELAATLYTGGDSTPDDAFDLASGFRYWMGADRNWALNLALRVELQQLDDTDEHCPIGGLLGLTFFPRFKSFDQLEAERAAAAAAAAEDAARQAAAAEAARKAAEEAAARQAAEEAARRAAAEEAARQAAAAPAPAPKPEVVETIHFSPGSARLSNIAKAKLDEVALRLQQDPTAAARIVGHSDARGSAAGNQALSERRAQAARDYLVQRHGIDPARIAVEGRGSSEPAASNDTADGRKENRRAVIVVHFE